MFTSGETNSVLRLSSTARGSFFAFCRVAFINFSFLNELRLSSGGISAGISTPHLAYVYINVFGLGFLGLGQSDSQNTVLILRFDFVSRHRRGKRHGALESPEEPFGTVGFRAFIFVFALALARNTQGAVMEGNIN